MKKKILRVVSSNEQPETAITSKTRRHRQAISIAQSTTEEVSKNAEFPTII
jgi:hypothetical protein